MGVMERCEACGQETGWVRVVVEAVVPRGFAQDVERRLCRILGRKTVWVQGCLPTAEDKERWLRRCEAFKEVELDGLVDELEELAYWAEGTVGEEAQRNPPKGMTVLERLRGVITYHTDITRHYEQAQLEKAEETRVRDEKEHRADDLADYGATKKLFCEDPYRIGYFPDGPTGVRDCVRRLMGRWSELEYEVALAFRRLTLMGSGKGTLEERFDAVHERLRQMEAKIDERRRLYLEWEKGVQERAEVAEGLAQQGFELSAVAGLCQPRMTAEMANHVLDAVEAYQEAYQEAGLEKPGGTMNMERRRFEDLRRNDGEGDLDGLATARPPGFLPSHE
jgi:hypothetical protein